MAKISRNGSQSVLKHGSKVLRDAQTGAADVGREAVDNVLAGAETVLQNGRKRISDWQEEALESIRTKPIQAVLIGVGIGCVLGFFLRRR